MNVTIILVATVLISLLVLMLVMRMSATFVPRVGFLTDAEVDAGFTKLLKKFLNLGDEIDRFVDLMVKDEHEITQKRCEFLCMRDQMERFVSKFERDVKNTSLIKAKRKNYNELLTMLDNMEAFKAEIAS